MPAENIHPFSGIFLCLLFNLYSSILHATPVPDLIVFLFIILLVFMPCQFYTRPLMHILLSPAQYQSIPALPYCTSLPHAVFSTFPSTPSTLEDKKQIKSGLFCISFFLILKLLPYTQIK